MELSQVSGFCKLVDIVVGSEEDFGLSKCGVKLNFISSIKEVSFDVVLQEEKSLLSNSVEISQVLLRGCEGFWESDLGLDFIGNEGKLLGIVVLDTAWLWYMQTVANIMRSMREHSKTNMVKSNKEKRTYGSSLGFLYTLVPTTLSLSINWLCFIFIN